MDKLRNSIKKKSNLIFIIMSFLFVIFLTSMILVLGNYGKTMKYYTKEYTALSGFSADVNEYCIAMERYANYGGEARLDAVLEAYHTAASSLSKIYNIRHTYTGNIYVYIEQIQSLYSGLGTVMEALDLDTDIHTVYNSSMKSQISDIISLSSMMIGSATESGASDIASDTTAAVAATVIMSVSFVAFCAMSVYCVWFIRKRVVYPIVDIAGWAKMFEEGYAEMSDLQSDYEDEFGELTKAFNIVKQRLLDANQLKSENEAALQKLRYEEEYKKKFVKQLYEEKREKESISNEAKRDGLTGLYNRKTFDALVQEFMEKKLPGTTGALFLVDMDNFKNVNDTLGHIAGDEALKILAGTMRTVFPGAYLGRYGGDEFVAFLTTGNEDVFRVKAMELCHKMDRTFSDGGKSVRLSVSAGVVSTEGMTEYSEMYLRVDRALYYAKEHGRNQFKMASDMND